MVDATAPWMVPPAIQLELPPWVMVVVMTDAAVDAEVDLGQVARWRGNEPWSLPVLRRVSGDQRADPTRWGPWWTRGSAPRP